VKTEPVQDLDEIYRVNLRAPYILTQALLPALQACQGQIIFMNSSAGMAKPGPNNGLYTIMKHGLRVLADSFRDAVNQDGIRVISFFPGRMATPMQARLFHLEGRPYRPELLIQPQDVVALLEQAVSLPRTVEVTDLQFRPMFKSY
jgi:NAD(P)-dependent dehydrogenase (short-subunit alcohol dehydrogenase family)